MAAALHLLHAINPGLTAVGRFRESRELQTGNNTPFRNSQHKNSRASLHSFANHARRRPRRQAMSQESCEDTVPSARVTIEIVAFFADHGGVAASSPGLTDGTSRARGPSGSAVYVNSRSAPGHRGDWRKLRRRDGPMAGRDHKGWHSGHDA